MPPLVLSVGKRGLVLEGLTNKDPKFIHKDFDGQSMYIFSITFFYYLCSKILIFQQILK